MLLRWRLASLRVGLRICQHGSHSRFRFLVVGLKMVASFPDWDFGVGILRTGPVMLLGKSKQGVTGDLSGVSGDRRYSPVPKARKQLGDLLCR